MRLAGGRDFRLILGAGIVSQLGDWSARLALALLVLERGGGPAYFFPDRQVDIVVVGLLAAKLQAGRVAGVLCTAPFQLRE